MFAQIISVTGQISGFEALQRFDWLERWLGFVSEKRRNFEL
jgi:hypothetical protein